MSEQVYKQLESKLMEDIKKDIGGLKAWIQKNQKVAEDAPQAVSFLESNYTAAVVVSNILKKYNGNYRNLDPIETANLILAGKQLEAGYKIFGESSANKYKEIKKTQEKIYKVMNMVKKPLEKSMKELKNYIKKNPDEGKKILQTFTEYIKNQDNELSEQKKGLSEKYTIVENTIKSYLPRK